MRNRVVPGVIAVYAVIAVHVGPASSASVPQVPVQGKFSVSAAKKSSGASTPVSKSTPVIQKSVIESPVDLDEAARAGVSENVLRMALTASSCAARSGAIDEPTTLTVIDYSRPSVEPRLWVFDLATGELLFRELVAHGRNTGENIATRFSNELDSHQSSIGLFVTDDTYVGTNGYSLRLDGLDKGFNDRARQRAIVMHGAPYVDSELAEEQGRIGRSWGCPALRPAIARKVIDRIRGGGVIFAYYPDQNWLASSPFLNCAANT